MFVHLWGSVITPSAPQELLKKLVEEPLPMQKLVQVYLDMKTSYSNLKQYDRISATHPPLCSLTQVFRSC